MIFSFDGWSGPHVRTDRCRSRRQCPQPTHRREQIGLLQLLKSAGSARRPLAWQQQFQLRSLPFDPANPDQDLLGVSSFRLAGWYDFRYVYGAQVALLAPAAAAMTVVTRHAPLTPNNE